MDISFLDRGNVTQEISSQVGSLQQEREADLMHEEILTASLSLFLLRETVL